MDTSPPPPFTIIAAPWRDHADTLYAIRYQVFVVEQNVPVALERDEHDPVCDHLLAQDRRGRGIGTGRLLADGHIGRLAVLAPWRGRGVGRALMLQLMERARRRGFGHVELSAQTHALAFYQSLGFVAEGEVYQEAGLPHRHMVATLGTSP